MTDKKQFNTNRPPEIVASELIRDIENYLFDSDIKVIFGEAGHDLVKEFVNQCNSDVEKYYDEAAKSYIENQRLREALEFYSNASNYIETWNAKQDNSWIDVVLDEGKIARKALAKQK